MVVEDLPALDQARVIGHYERFAETIGATFAGIPFTTVFLPQGFAGSEVRVSQLHTAVPAHVPTVDVLTRCGSHPYLALTPAGLLWRVHGYGIGFESWSPTAADPLRARFGRILVEPTGSASVAMVRDAAESVLRVLAGIGIDAAIAIDGPRIALWIPFDDAPDYPELRAWLQSVCEDAIRADAGLFETKRGEPRDRVRLSLRTNAPGQGSSLPYTLRCLPDFPVVLPIRRDELHVYDFAAISIEEAASRLAALGDVFAGEVARIGPQHFFSLARGGDASAAQLGPPFEFVPRAEVIQVAYDVLSDGKPRAAEDIIAAAVARGVWPAEKTRKYLYVMLKMYIEKTLARGREPLIVQDPDRRFRLNHTPDDLPDPKPAFVWTVPQALIDRVRAAATGDDPTAFEVAVCDAFVPLGFKTTHVGGTANPDGYADAMLGPLGYRFMIECKTSAKVMQRPDIFEAGKYKEQYGAQYAILIAPAFGDDKVIADECHTHGVSAWSVDDLCRCLELGATALEVRAMLEPGIAENGRTELEWNRQHGAAKRAAVVCDALLEAGWNAQAAAADFHAPADAPLLTEDAGMLLVDAYLHAHDSHTACTRDQVRAAFAYLTNPRVGAAVWADADRTSIVICRPLLN